jgi:hypothetical protein
MRYVVVLSLFAMACAPAGPSQRNGGFSPGISPIGKDAVAITEGADAVVAFALSAALDAALDQPKSAPLCSDEPNPPHTCPSVQRSPNADR